MKKSVILIGLVLLFMGGLWIDQGFCWDKPYAMILNMKNHPSQMKNGTYFMIDLGTANIKELMGVKKITARNVEGVDDKVYEFPLTPITRNLYCELYNLEDQFTSQSGTYEVKIERVDSTILKQTDPIPPGVTPLPIPDHLKVSFVGGPTPTLSFDPVGIPGAYYTIRIFDQDYSRVIYRSQPLSSPIVMFPQGRNRCTFEDLVPGETYIFRAEIIKPVSSDPLFPNVLIGINFVSFKMPNKPPPDTTPPTVPTGLMATPFSHNQINLTWNASEDNVGVAGYKIYRNGTYIASSETTSFSDTSLNPSTQYCYSLSAFDGAGNESAQTAQVCATTFPPFRVFPDYQFYCCGTGWGEYSYMEDGIMAYVNGSGGQYVWATLSVYDNLPLNFAVVHEGGGGGCASVVDTTGEGYMYILEICDSSGSQVLTLLKDHSYRIEVNAANAAGTFHRTTMTIEVAGPPIVDTVSPTVPSDIVASAISSSQIHLIWTPSSDNVSVSGYKIYRNGATTPTGSSPRASFTDSGLSPSTAYCYRISAYDPAGNQSALSSQICASTSSTPDPTAFSISPRRQYYLGEGYNYQVDDYYAPTSLMSYAKAWDGSNVTNYVQGYLVVNSGPVPLNFMVDHEGGGSGCGIVQGAPGGDFSICYSSGTRTVTLGSGTYPIEVNAQAYSAAGTTTWHKTTMRIEVAE